MRYTPWGQTRYANGNTPTDYQYTGQKNTDLVQMRYKPWGEKRYANGSTPTDYQYTGQRNTDLGIYFYNARWFDPALGRFLSADTIIPQPGNPLDWDRYSYTRNNPLRYTDPSGHMAWDGCTGETGGCGDANTHADYVYGVLHTDQERQQNNENLDTFTAVATTVIGIVSEPADWALTATACINGDCSPWMLLGLLPLIPSNLANKADNIAGLLDAPKRADWPHHHLLPQRFRSQFANLGINIDNHLVSLPRKLHEKIHRGARGGPWNHAWETWLSNNPNATDQQVYKQIGVMIHDFDLGKHIRIVSKGMDK